MGDNEPVVDESKKSHFEKRKRNLKAISPISRGEREIWIHFPQFREEKEKFENHFSNFERRKRKLNSLSLVSRREREIRQNILNFREEKEKFWLHFYNFEKRRRILNFFPFISRVEREKWNSLFLLEQSPVKWFSRQHRKCIWKLDRGQWLGLCWCDSGLWGWATCGRHKLIMAASSSFFQKLLRGNKHPQWGSLIHLFIYTRGSKSEDLLAVVNFLYHGEANVFQ